MAMTYEQFQDALRQKITSREQFTEVLRQAHLGNMDYWSAERDQYNLENRLQPTRKTVEGMRWPALRRDLTDYGVGMRIPGSQWWLVREWLRAFYGVYELTSDMWRWASHVDSIAQCVPHIALDGEDKTMIAYTPTVDDGMRDRQVRTSLGKFLRKTCLVLTDDYIRDTEAKHRSEMNDEVTFLVGDAIADAYMQGRPESCMAKPTDCFNTQGHHPARVYAETPELSLAVLYDGDGRINARALCYVNPDNPEDKRYVRVYGDSALTRRLQRRGFKLKGLAGARLKRIMLDEHPENDSRRCAALFPYIDPPGGPNGSGDPSHVRGVVPDGEWWRLLSAEQNAKVRSVLGKSPNELSNSGGWGFVHDFRYWLEEFKGMIGTCALTGAEFDLLATETVDVWHEGTVKRATAKAAAEAGFVRQAWVANNDDRQQALIGDDTPTFGAGNGIAVDNPSTRGSFGYLRLDAELYPTEQQYFQSWEATYSTKIDAEGRVARDEDGDGVELVVRVADTERVIARHPAGEAGYSTLVHKAHLAPVRDRLVRLASLTRGEELFALPDVPVHVTPSGRKVVIGVHAVAKTIDGMVDYTRNLTMFSGYGLSFYYRENDNGAPTLNSDYWRPLLRARLKERYFQRCVTRLHVFNSMVRLMRSLACGLFTDTLARADGKLQWMDGHWFSVSSLNDQFMRDATRDLESGLVNANRIISGELVMHPGSAVDWRADSDHAKVVCQNYKLCYELAAEVASEMGLAPVAQAEAEAEAATDEDFVLAAE